MHYILLFYFSKECSTHDRTILVSILLTSHIPHGSVKAIECIGCSNVFLATLYRMSNKEMKRKQCYA